MNRVLFLAALAACGGTTSDTPSPDAPPPPPATCGNGALDSGETCDGAALGGLSCAALGLGTGTLACRADCRGYDDSGCVPDDDDPCIPATCSSLGLTCGTAPDGCTGTLQCGTCPQPAAVWTAVGAGLEHTCALRGDGTMWCFGRNNFEQLGNAGMPFGSNTTPVRVGFAADWRSLTVGDQHACGTRADGTAWCWGRNDHGQLGNGTLVTTGTPVNYTEPQEVPYLALTAGTHHTCGLRDGGGLRTCAGSITNGTLYPTPGYNGAFFAMVASGGDASCGVDTNNRLWCDALGDNETSNGARAWRALDVGDGFWCALTTTGALYCQGFGIWGQLGDGTSQSSSTPVQAGSSLTWTTVSAGGRHACGIASDSTLYCWGANDAGQLGDGTTQRRAAPAQVSGGWRMVSAGTDHTCGTKLDGSLWCWGKGANGRLGNGATENALSPIRVTDP